MANKLETYSVKDWVVLGETFFKPPFKVSDALINEARIVYVVHGNSKLYSPSGNANLSSGDLLIMKTDNFVNHWQENESGEENHVIAFQLNSEFLKHLYESEIPDWFKQRDSVTQSVVKCGQNRIIEAYFDGLLSYFNSPKLLTEDLLKIKIKELISIMIQTDERGQLKHIFGNLFTSSDFAFKEVIQKNLYENLNLEELAFLTSLSLSSFKRKFNSVYGTTPNKYITSKRLENAQTLLNTTDLTIAEIAYDSGFSDLGYFSKIFRKNFNVSPSEYRKDMEG